MFLKVLIGIDMDVAPQKQKNNNNRKIKKQKVMHNKRKNHSAVVNS